MHCGESRELGLGRGDRDSMPFDYEKTIAQMPHQPGVYLMKDASEHVVYVGKAKDLAKRVKQYFTGHDDRSFVASLDKILSRIDVIITNTEREALILEAGLIKRYMPRFNVVLKDDKAMPLLRIDMHDEWPRVELVRRRKKDGALYFGPFPSGQACRVSLNVVNRYFKLRMCKDTYFNNRSRPCLQYEIHRCPAPCVYQVDRDAYMENCSDAVLFLSGKYESLKKSLETRMFAASEALAFEQAAHYRDQIKAIESISESQKIVQKSQVDQDFWAIDGAGALRAIVVMIVRDGCLQQMQTYEARDGISDIGDIMSQIMVHHYSHFEAFPSEICLGHEFSSLKSLIGDNLFGLSSKKVAVTFPQRGIKADLLATAYTNAHQQFVQRRTNESSILERVQKTLNLKRYPHRIECYDISNMQGGQIVAAMVVFIEGRLDPSRCRTFKIRTTEGQDDFGSMFEVISRRLQYLQPPSDDENEERGEFGQQGEMVAPTKHEKSFSEMPDFLLIDGGHGQVHAVCDAVAASGFEGVFDIVGIGKARMQDETDKHDIEHSPERLYYPGGGDPLVLDQTCDEILLMANIRDETHARAIGFHRKLRHKDGLHSRLDDVDGIGAKRKQKLLKEFGSLREIVKQTPETIAQRTGISVALAQKMLELLK